MLLTPFADGTIPIELLIVREYDNVVRRLGTGTARIRPRATVSSSHIQAYHAPRRPHELIGALQDSVHVSTKRIISTTPIKTKGIK